MKIDVIVIIDSRLERLWQFCKCVKRETLVKFAVTAYHIFWHVDISKVKEKLANTRIELYIENESFFVSRINEKRILFHSTRLISSSFFFFSNETFFFLFLNRSKKIHDKIQIDEIFFFFNFGDILASRERGNVSAIDVNLSRYIPRPRPFESH